MQSRLPVGRGDGVEINFDGADIQTVAKTLLGDVLKLNFVVDPHVQGNVTLASVGPIPRKDVLPAFESVLRMSNAAIVRDGVIDAGRKVLLELLHLGVDHIGSVDRIGAR